MKKFLLLFLIIPTLCFAQIANWTDKTVEELSGITSGVTNIASKAYWEEHAYLQIYDVIAAYGICHILDASDGTPDSVVVVDAAGNVTIGYYSTLTSLKMKGDSLYIEDATAHRPILILKNTNADAHSATLKLIKDSASPADNDRIGQILFTGDDSVGTATDYVWFNAKSSDITNGDEGGLLDVLVTVDGTLRSFIRMEGAGGGVNLPLIIFNESSKDMDFRVESDNSANALFIDGGTGRVSVLNASADSALTVTGGGHFSGGLVVDGTFTGTMSTNKLDASDGDPDSVIVVDADGDVSIGAHHSMDKVKITGDTLWITDSGVGNPMVIIETTDAGTYSPFLFLRKDSATPADGDDLGYIYFRGDDSGGTENTFVDLLGESADVTDTDEAGKFTITVARDGSMASMLILNGYNGTVGQGEIIFNEDSKDFDFRVESDNDANAFFVEGSSGDIGFGTNDPTGDFHLSEMDSIVFGSATTLEPTLVLQNTNTDAADAELHFNKYPTSSAANDDSIGTIRWYGYDSGNNQTTYSRLVVTSAQVTNGSESSVIEHLGMQGGAANRFLKFDGYKGSVVGTGEVIINEDSDDTDFRVESDNDTSAFFVQGSDGKVGILNAAPDSALTVTGGVNVSQGLRVDRGATFNEDSNDADFRVESNANENALFVDAGNNRVGILNNAPAKALHVMGDVAIGDSAAATTNRYLYFATDGLCNDEYLAWDEANTMFYFSDSLSADGYIDYCDVYLGDATKAIMKIKPVKGAKKGKKRSNYIALDHNTLPYGVKTTGMDGRDARNLSKLVSVMIGAMQEQQEEIKSLKKRLKKLDGK